MFTVSGTTTFDPLGAGREPRRARLVWRSREERHELRLAPEEAWSGDEELVRELEIREGLMHTLRPDYEGLVLDRDDAISSYAAACAMFTEFEVEGDIPELEIEPLPPGAIGRPA